MNPFGVCSYSSGAGVVGDAGTPITVTGYTFTAINSSGLLSFYNGQSSSDPLVYQSGGGNAASERIFGFFFKGLRFPKGLYVTVANGSSSVVFYRQT